MLIGEATIRIDADTVGLKKQVSQDLNDALGTLKPASKPLDDVAKKAKEADGNLKKMNKTVDGLLKGVLASARGVAQWALSFSALAGTMNFLPAAASALFTLSGALFLAVPAGIALGGVMAAVKLGADGAKRAIAQLNPTLDVMKKKVSASFESALVPAVNNLKVALPPLTNGLQQIATAVGGVATKVSIWLKSNDAIKQLQALLGGTARVVQNLGGFVTPLIQAFVKIGSTAMPILIQMTAGAGAAGERFNALIQRMADTGALTAWIHSALDGFKAIGSVLGDVIAIIRAVFGAIQEAGGSMGGVLGSVLGTVKAFVQSTEGHATLVALAQAINAIGTAVSTVLMSALKAIGPAIPSLVSAFSQLVAILTPTVVAIVDGLGVAFGKVAEFLAANMQWIGPVAIALAEILLVVKGLLLVLKAWEVLTIAVTVAQWAWNAALDANPIGIVVLAIAALVAVIIVVATNLDWFRARWDDVWKFVSDVVTKVVQFVKGAWQGFVSWLSGTVAAIGTFFKTIGAGIVNGFTAAINFIKGLPAKVGAFLLSLPSVLFNAWLNAAKFMLNAVVQGIEWIIALLLALPVKAIMAIIQFGPMLYDWAINAFINLGVAVVAGIANVIQWFTELPGRILLAVAEFAIMIRDWAVGSFIALKNGFIEKAAEIIIWVRGLPGRILEGLAELGSKLIAFAKTAWTMFLDGVKTTAGNMLDWVKSIPGWILDRLGDMGRLLIEAGRNLIEGLWNGIQGMAKWLWDKVTGFVGGIVDKFKSILHISSPSKVFADEVGHWIPAGIGEGILANANAVHGALSTLATDAVNGMDADGIGKPLGQRIAEGLNAGFADAVSLAASVDGLSLKGGGLPDLPDPTGEATRAQRAAAEQASTAAGQMADHAAGLPGAIADAMTGVAVVVSATEANSGIKRVQQDDKRRR
jgi:phage-related protein